MTNEKIVPVQTDPGVVPAGQDDIDGLGPLAPDSGTIPVSQPLPPAQSGGTGGLVS